MERKVDNKSKNLYHIYMNSFEGLRVIEMLASGKQMTQRLSSAPFYTVDKATPKSLKVAAVVSAPFYF